MSPIGDARRTAGSVLAVAALLLVAATAAGCTPVRHGVMPHVERLDTLRVGVSTVSNVLLVLGEPRGRGVARLRPELEARNVWLYEFTTADSGLWTRRVELTFLLVFMRNDIYEGYLWLASADALRVQWQHRTAAPGDEGPRQLATMRRAP